MDLCRLQDRISRAMGLIAKRTGDVYTVCRPVGIDPPNEQCNRVIRLRAAFKPGREAAGTKVGSVVWKGMFDTLYTHVGDYLFGKSMTFFIATQSPTMAVECVLTNCRITVVRRSSTTQGGYEGKDVVETIIARNWPSCLSSVDGSVGSNSVDGKLLQRWILLLPKTVSDLQESDIVTDDRGYRYIVAKVEGGLFGWRAVLSQTGR